MAFTEDDLKRLRWHSRRGMLELDLILVPFAEQQLEALGDERLARYRNLLAQEDQDLFSWFIRRNQPASSELKDMVDFILFTHVSQAPGQTL